MCVCVCVSESESVCVCVCVCALFYTYLLAHEFEIDLVRRFLLENKKFLAFLEIELPASWFMSCIKIPCCDLELSRFEFPIFCIYAV